jgi:S-adenosylmethionine decarboxylase
MREAAELAGASVLHCHTHRFAPQGITVVLTLSESHASLHTYPEHGVYMADVFTCGDVKPARAMEHIVRAFGGKYKSVVWERGDVSA